MTTNGKIPSSELVKLSTPGYLTADAAKSFERLLLRTGTTGTENANEAYRSYEEQAHIFQQNYTRTYTQYEPGHTDRRVWNGVSWYRKKGYASAAVPGTSFHGFGIAVDFQNLGGYGTSTWNAFAAIAIQHGWTNVEGKTVNEPWHWLYNKTEDNFISKDNDMLVTVKGRTSFKLISGGLIHAISEADKTRLVAAGIPYAALDIVTITAIEAATAKLLEGGTITVPPITIPPIVVPPVTVKFPQFDIAVTGTAKPHA